MLAKVKQVAWKKRKVIEFLGCSSREDKGNGFGVSADLAALAPLRASRGLEVYVTGKRSPPVL